MAANERIKRIQAHLWAWGQEDWSSPNFGSHIIPYYNWRQLCQPYTEFLAKFWKLHAGLINCCCSWTNIELMHFIEMMIVFVLSWKVARFYPKTYGKLVFLIIRKDNSFSDRNFIRRSKLNPSKYFNGILTPGPNFCERYLCSLQKSD